jgi:broad specificity phosphatase PhoE
LLEWQLREEPDESCWSLTEAGHRQARLTGDWIRQNLDSNIHGAYVSPFVRTRETALDLGLEVEWTVDERLREREWGDYQAPGAAAYSAGQYLIDLSRCAEPSWKSPFPGAESINDLVPRARAFLQDVRSATPHGRVICVTHGGTIRAFQALLEPVGADSRCRPQRLTNCCVVNYRLDQGGSDRLEWRGAVRTAHPTEADEPSSDWEPVCCPAPV